MRSGLRPLPQVPFSALDVELATHFAQVSGGAECSLARRTLSAHMGYSEYSHGPVWVGVCSDCVTASVTMGAVLAWAVASQRLCVC